VRSGTLALPAGVALAAELLDLSPPIEAEAVQRAFRATALRVHPDHGGTERQFRALVQARDMLLAYTAGGHRETEPPRQAYTESRRRSARVFGWRRSAKGNLWRKLGGLLVTVFETDDGFKWVRDGDYSDYAWLTEAEACRDAEETWS